MLIRKTLSALVISEKQLVCLPGRFAKSVLALSLAITAAACAGESGTEPATGSVSPEGTLRLEAVSATRLEGTVSEAVNPVPTVMVRSGSGRPVEGVKVTFTPLYEVQLPSPAHDVTTRIATTDSRGIATPGDWMLGTQAYYVYHLEASIQGAHVSDADKGVGRTVTFDAQAKAAAPVALVGQSLYDSVALAGDEIDAPQVGAKDRFGNSVVGVPITFAVASGGGSLGKSPGTWILGPNPGLNSLVASAPGLGSLTFTTRALDVGWVTWYDLPKSSIRLIVSASIALCENGNFELVTVETSDALPGEFRERRMGTFTVTDDRLVLTFQTGGSEVGTVTADRVSFLHKKDNWVREPPLEWNFVRRK